MLHPMRLGLILEVLLILLGNPYNTWGAQLDLQYNNSPRFLLRCSTILYEWSTLWDWNSFLKVGKSNLLTITQHEAPNGTISEDFYFTEIDWSWLIDWEGNWSIWILSPLNCFIYLSLENSFIISVFLILQLVLMWLRKKDLMFGSKERNVWRHSHVTIYTCKSNTISLVINLVKQEMAEFIAKLSRKITKLGVK